MKSIRVVLLVIGTAVLLSAFINAPREYNPELSIRYSRDLVWILLVVMACSRVVIGRVVSALATVLWLLALVFEWIRSVGVTAMSQEPLLYDAYFLVGHLYNLMTDLMGFKAQAMFAGVVVAVVAIGIMTAWLFRRIQIQHAETPWFTHAVTAALVVGMAAGAEQWGGMEGKNSLFDASHNAVDSVSVHGDIARGISPDAYRAIRELKLGDHRPSVHIYIVESYGNGIQRQSIREGYFAMVDGIEERLESAGWTIRTGLSEAPVMGGRSWLADATLLSGRLIKYESVYRHFLPHLATIATVPGFFKDNGYQTVLMRHNDRARPGLPLQNFFEFEQTVFQAEVGYEGPAYGWAGIPDQYALGHLRDEVLPGIWDSPHFVFVHLASSHIPWDDVPPLVSDWRSLDGKVGAKTGTQDAPLTEKQIKYQLKRFKRKETVRLRRLKPSEENVQDYLTSVSYSIEAVVQHVLAMEQPPDVVVVMGDHQPPLYKKNTDFSVPVHVMATDPSYLREFRKRGFRNGMRPTRWSKRIRHEGFFSVLVRALARPHFKDLPPYRRHGTRAASEKSKNASKPTGSPDGGSLR